MSNNMCVAFTEPESGAIPVAVGMSTIARIPIPGTNGLAIELRPRGFVPVGGSTSHLFFQDVSGSRHLRLDYGFNKNTNMIEWHWNQKSTHSSFGVSNHTPAHQTGAVVGNAARTYRHMGRALLVYGAAVDFHSIVSSSQPLKRTVEVASAWAGATLGCRTIGAGGAAMSSYFGPYGTAAGGIAGCVVGGFVGYTGGERFGGAIYDWAESTVFTPLVETTASEIPNACVISE